MNVSARSSASGRRNALCIPVEAVERGNTVLLPGPGALDEDGERGGPSPSWRPGRSPWAGTMTSISRLLDGLEEGDVVLISNQASSSMDMMMGG